MNLRGAERGGRVWGKFFGKGERKRLGEGEFVGGEIAAKIPADFLAMTFFLPLQGDDCIIIIK